MGRLWFSDELAEEAWFDQLLLEEAWFDEYVVDSPAPPAGDMVGNARLEFGGNAYWQVAGVFGDNTAGSTTFPSTNNRAVVTRFQVPVNCDVATIYVRYDATSTAGTNSKAIVYADGVTVPTTRIAFSNSVAVPNGGGIVSHTISLPGLIAGQWIWMGSVVDSFSAIWQQDTTGGLSRMDGMNYTTPDATWTQGGTSAQGVNVWAEFITLGPNGEIVGSTTVTLTPTGTMTNVGGGMIGSASLSLAPTGTIINLTPPTTANIGNETLYTDALPSAINRMLGEQFTMPEDGTLQTLHLGFAAGSLNTFNVKGLLYSDVANLPVSLLATGSAETINTGGGWAVSTIADTFMAAGTKFWIFAITDDNAGFGEHAHNTFGTGVGEDAFMVQPGSFSYASPPATMPAATSRYDYDCSMYATYLLPSGGMVASTTINLAPAGTLAAAGAMVASASLSLVPSGTLGGKGELISHAVDPYEASVTSRILFDGANGSTTLLDEKAVSWSVTAPTALSTAVAKFGPTSLLNSTGGAFGSNALGGGVGTGDFTIRLWAYPTSTSTRGVFDAALASSAASIAVGWDQASGTWQLYLNGGVFSSAPTTLTLNTQQHLELVRFGSTVVLFHDGQPIITTTSSANLTFPNLHVGRYYNTSFPWIGYLDDLEVTVGVARHTAAFVPPTQSVGRTPTLAIGLSGTLTNAIGQMTGSTSLALTPSATLSASAALTGSSALSLAPSGTLVGAGAVIGSAAVSFTPAGSMIGAVPIVGATTLTLVPSATLAGSIDLVGSTTLSFALTATATTPSGDIVGSTSLSLAAAGTLTGAAPAVGSTSVTFSLTGTGALSGALVGSSSLSFVPSATLAGAGVLVGSSSIALAPSATLAGSTPAVGSTSIAFAPTGSMQATATLVGSTTLAFAPTGTIVGLQTGMSGTVGINFAPSATLAGVVAASGTASLALVPSATGSLRINIAGTSSLSFVAAATGNIFVPIVGSTSLALSASGTMAALASMSGSTSLAFDPSATSNLIGQMDGAAVIAMSLTAQLLAQASMAGSTSLTFYGQATPLGGEPPPGEVVIINLDAGQDGYVTVQTPNSDANVIASGLDNGSSVAYVDALGVDSVYVGL